MTAGDERADAALVEAARRGDRRALDVLLRRHYERVWTICRRLAGNDDDALDAAQEALIVLVRRIDRYDGRAAFTTWMYRVVTNACVDELRRRGRRPVPVREVPERPADRPGPDERVADQMAVDAGLAHVPLEFRAALVLRDACDLDYGQIAEILDIPPGTVRSRIARGRAALVDALSGNHPTRSPRPT